MAIDLVKAGQQCLGEEAENLQGALVYLDDGALEAFHFLGGLPFLLQLGARGVCQLENASACDETVVWNGVVEELSRIVIVTSQLLSDSHCYVLRCIRTHAKIHHFVILSSISQDAHSNCGDTPLGTDAFTEYKDLLLQDVLKALTPDERLENSSGPSVTVKHLPMLCCAVTPRVFVFPSSAAFATAPLSSKREVSFLSPGLPAYDNGLAWDEDELPPAGATLHAHFLHDLAGQLDLKFDIFSLGPLAHLVGKQLTEISGDGFGRAKKTAGLLLLDRSLDLITPASHGDSLVDKIYSFLPRQTHQESTASVKRPSMDVRIPTLEEEKSFVLETGDETTYEIAGSLCTAWDFQGVNRLDILFEKRAKDGALLVRNWIQDILRQEHEVSGKSRLVTNSKELFSLATTLLNSSAGLKQAGLVQLGKAAAEVTTAARVTQWEAFASAERVLGISAADGIETLASQLGDLIRQSTSDHSVLSLRDALTILIVGYALAGEYSTKEGGPFSWEEERSLKEAVTDAILKGPAEPSLDFLKGLENALEMHWEKEKTKAQNQISSPDDWSEDQWESWEDNDQQEYSQMQLKLELNDRIQELFNALHRVAAARTHYPLRETRLLGTHRGVINELLSLVLSNSDIPGLKHHSSTVGRFLKSGLGRFGLGQAKHKLSDHKVLLVFVIGGFNAVEVREARALQGDFDELLMGGTTLLTPNAMFDLLLGSCHL
ncbi:sec1 family domain-containing protein MIP3 [Selaginella moellendorffii]|uniref:sec1 family domain-containing protein MIP3 n=1 Tax=Selaginella moellendorffii TaxID=88036 RepID=UPI000D1C8902|nr:sec1 family domain-containing protein MIP3 [Selaginella moellendorffii]|eukprot:XP_024518035.1 sec1 family domain-containing protein MIP3 [Selaginella moellendorffii]